MSDGTIIGKRQVAIVYHATSNRPKIEILKLTHKLTTRSAQQRSTLHVLRTDKRGSKKILCNDTNALESSIGQTRTSIIKILTWSKIKFIYVTRENFNESLKNVHDTEVSQMFISSCNKEEYDVKYGVDMSLLERKKMVK